MINKYNTICMIYFVLKDPSKKPLNGNTKLPAIYAYGANTDFFVARHFAVNIANTQAALVICHYGAFVLGYLRVNKNRERSVLFVVIIVTYNDYSQQLVYLYCGQRHANFMVSAIFPV